MSLVDDVLGTIAAEAGGSTRTARFRDMQHVASVVRNRMAQLGVSAMDVVRAPGEFSAFGRAYPPGTRALRSLAKQAWDSVAVNPVTSATFYATPTARNRLPDGLQDVATTEGHIYAVDPQGRAVRTAQGYKRPTMVSLPDSAPVPPARQAPGANINRQHTLPPGYASSSVRTAHSRQVSTGTQRAMAGLTASTSTPAPSRTFTVAQGRRTALSDVTRETAKGLAALAPHGLIGRSLTFDQSGARRSKRPASDISQKVAQSFQRVVPGGRVSLYAGQEPPGTPPVNSPYRHPVGLAGDFQFYDPTGKRITDEKTVRNIARQMASDFGANIGYSQDGSYMPAGNVHIDQVDVRGRESRLGKQWGATAGSKDWADDLNFERVARQLSPDSPKPTPRPSPISSSFPARPEFVASNTPHLTRALEKRGISTSSFPARPGVVAPNISRTPALDRALADRGLQSTFPARPDKVAPNVAKASPAPSVDRARPMPSGPARQSLTPNLDKAVADRVRPMPTGPMQPTSQAPSPARDPRDVERTTPVRRDVGTFNRVNIAESPARDPRDMANVAGPNMPPALARAVVRAGIDPRTISPVSEPATALSPAETFEPTGTIATRPKVMPTVPKAVRQIPTVASAPVVAPVAQAPPASVKQGRVRRTVAATVNIPQVQPVALPSVSPLSQPGFEARYTGLRPGDIYSGAVGQALSTGGNIVARENSWGPPTVTNRYGVTTAMLGDKQAAYHPSFGVDFSGFGQKGKTMIGSLAGAALGSLVAGPAGSVIGGLAGRTAASSSGGGMIHSLLGGLFGGGSSSKSSGGASASGSSGGSKSTSSGKSERSGPNRSRSGGLY